MAIEPAPKIKTCDEPYGALKLLVQTGATVDCSAVSKYDTISHLMHIGGFAVAALAARALAFLAATGRLHDRRHTLRPPPPATERRWAGPIRRSYGPGAPAPCSAHYSCCSAVQLLR